MSAPASDRPSILIVDDDPGLAAGLAGVLIRAGFPRPMIRGDGRDVMETLADGSFDLILLDLIMPHLGGLDLLPRIKADHPEIEVLIVTAVDDAATAVTAMKHDAFDYLVKPIDKERLIIAVQRALERKYLRRQNHFTPGPADFDRLKHPEAFSDMIARDPVMADLFSRAETMARSDYNLVITGESGTGKELLARAVHRLSPRSGGPFVAVNMAALSSSLADSQLFGHTRGAFTGAGDQKPGFFETAERGTLFLDEITEMDPALQAKLLRVVQERELYRLGASTARAVDVRIVAASNQKLEQEVRRGAFRPDLYYRLNTCRLHIPPLKERPADVPALAEHFLAKHAARNHKDIRGLSPELARRLARHPFPGNVRELENIVAAAVLMETTSQLTPAAAPDLASEPPPPGENHDLIPLELAERRHIQRVMAAVDQDTVRAAEILGLGLRTLQRRLKGYRDADDAAASGRRQK